MQRGIRVGVFEENLDGNPGAILGGVFRVIPRAIPEVLLTEISGGLPGGIPRRVYLGILVRIAGIIPEGLSG